LRHAADPIGRRGAVLILSGLCFVAFGARLLGPQHPGYLDAHRAALRLAPMGAWGALFVAAGLLAFVASRVPPGRDRWGFYTLAPLAVWWSATGPLSSMGLASALLVFTAAAGAVLAVLAHSRAAMAVGAALAVLGVVGAGWSVAVSGMAAPGAWIWPEAVIWAGVAAVLVIVSGWAEPIRPG
jgi:hypothetical protein